MNFLERIALAANIVFKSASVPLNFINRSSSNPFRSYNGKTSAQQFQSWVFSAVTSIAEEIAKSKIRLNKRLKDGTIERLMDHDAMKLLDHPNEYFTRYKLLYRLQANKELRGSEYWFIEKKGKTPIAIYPLQPEKVTPIGGKYDYIEYFEYRLGSEVLKLKREDVISFQNYNPDSDIVGKSTLEAASDSVETDDYARTYNKSFFKNSAQPGVILEYPSTLTSAQLARLKEDWNVQFQGPNNNYRTAVAAGGLKVTKLEQTHAEMEFTGQRTYSRDEILAIFKVPKEIFGAFEDANYAGSSTADRVFAQRTIDPKVRAIVDVLNAFYLPMWGDESLFFDYYDVIPDDLQTLSAFLSTGVSGGIITPNEARQRLGFGPLENGDQTYLPFNLVPGSQVAQQEKIIYTEVSMKESRLKAMAKDIASVLIEIKDEEAEIQLEAPDTTMAKDVFESLGAKRVSVTQKLNQPYEDRLKKEMAQLFEEQKKRALENLVVELDKKAWKASNFNLLDTEKEVKITLDLFKKIFEELVKQSGQAAFELLGIEEEFQISSPSVQDFIKKNTKRFAGEVTETTTTAIRETISQGVGARESIEQLKARITELTAFNESRAELIARTETVRASGKSDLLAWKESGVVSEVVWYTAQDERVCPICGPLNGKQVGLNKSFLTLEEMQRVGVTDYDGSVKAPPAHPQCRCTLLPVIDKSKSFKSLEYRDQALFMEYLQTIK